MLRVPSLQLSLPNPDKLVSDSAVFLVHHTLLADFVTLPLRDDVDPEDVVNTTEQDANIESVRVEYSHHFCRKYSHSNASYAVRSVPEAHGATVGTALRWNPRHDEEKDLDQNEQADCDIPRLEL